MTRVDLNETAVITLDGSGNGTARLGPLTAREVWFPENVSVKANSNPTDEAQCQIYKGREVSQEFFRDNTFSGSSGDASDKVAGQLKNSEYIFAVWSGGDADVQATMTVTGTKEV